MFWDKYKVKNPFSASTPSPMIESLHNVHNILFETKVANIKRAFGKHNKNY